MYMKKIITLLLITFSVTAMAQHHHHGYDRGWRYNPGWWVAPAVIGGAVVYGMTRPSAPPPPPPGPTPTPCPALGCFPTAPVRQAALVARCRSEPAAEPEHPVRPALSHHARSHHTPARRPGQYSPNAGAADRTTAPAPYQRPPIAIIQAAQAAMMKSPASELSPASETSAATRSDRIAAVSPRSLQDRKSTRLNSSHRT